MLNETIQSGSVTKAGSRRVKTHKPESAAALLTFRDPVLTSIVPDDEIHIGPELERTEQMMTHEVL